MVGDSNPQFALLINDSKVSWHTCRPPKAHQVCHSVVIDNHCARFWASCCLIQCFQAFVLCRTASPLEVTGDHVRRAGWIGFFQHGKVSFAHLLANLGLLLLYVLLCSMSCCCAAGVQRSASTTGHHLKYHWLYLYCWLGNTGLTELPSCGCGIF